MSIFIVSCLLLCQEGQASEICRSPSLNCVDDYEDYCKLHMPPASFRYISIAAMRESTRDSNQNAFRKILLSPRHFVGDLSLVLQRTIRSTNQIAAFPVGIAPTAWHIAATPDGELATVRAAKNMNTLYISSLESSTSMKDIAQDKPDAMRWQQMCMFQDKDFMLDFLSRMEVAGVAAVVLTIDKYKYPTYWKPGGVPPGARDTKLPNYPHMHGKVLTQFYSLMIHFKDQFEMEMQTHY